MESGIALTVKDNKPFDMEVVVKAGSSSIKTRIFVIFLLFTIVLLGVLWFFQIIYLDDFYKILKKHETENVLAQTQEILEKNDEDIELQLDKLAASHKVAIFVTDKSGAKRFCAEHLSNSELSSMPNYLFKAFYKEAKQENGEALIEYQGSKLKKALIDEGLVDPDDLLKKISDSSKKIKYTISDEEYQSRFIQNEGDDYAESIILVKIIGKQDKEQVIMVNSVLTPVDATVMTLKIELIVISGLVIIISLLIATIFSNKLTKSIVDLNEKAKTLAKGDYSVKFNSREYKEISELTDTLNYAAGELNKIDSLQKELIANVSHDLRTPLTLIKGYSEVMRDIPGEDTPENIQQIIDETDRMTMLVNDLLDISRIQAGMIELNLSHFNITESIKAVLERYNKLCMVGGYHIDFVYDEEVFVFADEQKIFQVIYNLVSNAINYTGDDKLVTVSQIVKNDILRIEVKDTGKGVSQEDIPYIWDRYYKDKKNHKRAVQGTGLGLSIVKNILEMHNAHYGVFSKNDQGATFWFELKRS